MIKDNEEEVLVYESDYFQGEDDTVEIKPTYIKREWGDVPSEKTYKSWVSETDDILNNFYS